MNNYDKYIVQKGDTLYSIAKKYGTTIAEIVDVNTLTSNMLYPNQELFIPRGSMDEVYVDKYITKGNDTIEKIAEALNVTPSDLGKYNDFGKLILKSGQSISVPKTLRTYKIEEGDTLMSIMRKTGLTAEQILELNAGNWLKTDSVIYI
ncbi:MAG: LysM peptidoglycan-binding domain-containing protein [Bacilli bacterium]|nr:LysM peptidoglycan-binding domain-containing protein [Bacilli bacterium]